MTLRHLNPTLHRSLRPRGGQQAHPPNHKILKRLIIRFPLLAHVIGKTRYLGRRVVIFVFEGRFEPCCLIVLTGGPLYDVGFRAPLLRCGEGGIEALKKASWTGA